MRDPKSACDWTGACLPVRSSPPISTPVGCSVLLGVGVAVSGVASRLRPMTSKRSEFGSLAQRMGGAKGAALGVRHVWLDGTVPALVTDRRQVSGAWQGLVLYMGTAGPVHEWVEGERILRL